MTKIVKNSVSILLLCMQLVIASACNDNGNESNNTDKNNTKTLKLCVSTLYSNKEVQLYLNE